MLNRARCHADADKSIRNDYSHPGLTTVNSVRFVLFEIKCVLVYNSTTFYFTDLFILYIFIQNTYADIKV